MIMDSKLFNLIVNTAVQDRNLLQGVNSYRYSLEAIEEYQICRLYCHPFNGVYAEKPIGYGLYYIDANGKVQVEPINNL